MFEDTVKTLNNYYAEAEKINSQSYLEGCLACVSAYIIFLCMETRYEKVLRCSSFNPFTQQSAVTIFLLKSLHIASFDERETSAIQSLQCFCKDWIQFWCAIPFKCDHTCIQRSRRKLFMNAPQKMFWCLMCSNLPCLQMHPFTYKFTLWLHAEVLAPVCQWLHLNFGVLCHGQF